MTKQPGKLSRADFKYLMSLLNKVQEAEKEIENDGDNKAEAVAIIVGLFVGLIGGPIASLVYYESSPEKDFTYS